MELINLQNIGSGKTTQNYSSTDDSLISVNIINSSFGDQNDYVEYFIYDERDDLLEVNYNYIDYSLENKIGSDINKYSSIKIDPINDVKKAGYERGVIYIQYNFLKTLFNSNPNTRYWIKEISTSRLELKLTSQKLSGNNIKAGVAGYENYVLSKNYYSDFYLNFGKNELLIGVNAAYIEDEFGDSYLLIKLYEPLPLDYDVKSQLWINDKIAESVSYRVDIQTETIALVDANRLRGPNYNIRTFERVGQTTPFYSYDNLFSSPVSSSIQKLMSYYEDKALSINVDYSDFNNFIHFSSATERINNFAYKIQLIEKYNWEIDSQNALYSIGVSDTYTSSSILLLKNNINRIIEKFDPYEYYLYYSSESFAWPKSTSTQPYALYSYTSSQVQNWLGSANIEPSTNSVSILYSASIYDSQNKDALIFSIPSYLYDDAENQPYLTFMNMVGQHFDNLWIYYKDITNRYNATNNPHTGVSLDVVADAIRSFGVELYTNTNLSDQIYYTLFGIGQSGTLLPPTGSEIIDTYVTSSLTTLPYDQIQKEVYKRIYHNLPYLLKTKGTARGIKALIACYGIPESLLSVNEFGGYDRFDQIGIFEINNSKINIISQSLELSQSLLSPYSTVQYYDNDNRLNTTNLEIGFSPSDKLNKNISSSLLYFNIDDYIGNPAYQYSSSYTALDKLRNDYFQSYTKKHNIWEYIRLVKYYNNSLFKMVKDFVPARANISSGVIIKPHILERSKYARHEPIVTNNVYTQSIEILDIEASHANSYSGSDSTIKKLLSTNIGYIPFTSSFGFEKYTGEFQGSQLLGRYSNYFDQRENSNNQTAFSASITQSYIISNKFNSIAYRSDDNPLGIGPVSILRPTNFQNIFTSIRSKKYFDLDYSSNSLVPVNFSTISESINRSIIDNYSTYNDSTVPYAYLQDTNYVLRSFTDPRYYGSKSQSSLYNIYTSTDSSYGNNAAIDKIKKYFAYLVKITPPTLTLPNRSNAQIKYLINDKSRVIDLSKANTNIFESQNIFKTTETVDISLFNYDLNNLEIRKLSNNATFNIYQGGFRYVPILHNISGSHIQYFDVFPPVKFTYTVTAGGFTPSVVPKNVKNRLYYQISWNVDSGNPDNHTFSVKYTPGGTLPSGNYTASVSFIWGTSVSPSNQLWTNGPTYAQVTSITPSDPAMSYSSISVSGGSYYLITATFYGGGSSTVSGIAAVTNTGGAYTWFAGDVYTGTPPTNPSITQQTLPPVGAQTITFTDYVTVLTSSIQQSCLYYLTGSNYMVLGGAPAEYYDYNITYRSNSDSEWSSSIMEQVVTPFNISVGDEIHLWNPDIGWYESEEYVIKSSFLSGSYTGSRLFMELDRDVNMNSITASDMPDPVYGWQSGSCRYIIVKKLPDETNIVLRYNASSSIEEEGMVYPKYIDENLRKSSGDIIKSLKSENLI